MFVNAVMEFVPEPNLNRFPAYDPEPILFLNIHPPEVLCISKYKSGFQYNNEASLEKTEQNEILF